MIQIKAEERDGNVSFQTEWDREDGVSVFSASLTLMIKVVCALTRENIEKRKELYKMAAAAFGALQNEEAEAELFALLGEEDGKKHTAEG